MLKLSRYSLFMCYRHCNYYCHSYGDTFIWSFPWLLPPCRIPSPLFVPWASVLRNSEMNGTSFQAQGRRVKNLYSSYVASIVKWYKRMKRRGKKTDVRRTRQRRQCRMVECRVSVQMHLTPPFLLVFVSPSSPWLLFPFFIRVHVDVGLATPSISSRDMYETRSQPSEKIARQIDRACPLMRRKALSCVLLWDTTPFFVRFFVQQSR